MILSIYMYIYISPYINTVLKMLDHYDAIITLKKVNKDSLLLPITQSVLYFPVNFLLMSFWS